MKESILAIAIPLEEELLKPLHHWGENFDWSHVTTVHFLHIVKKVVMPLEFAIAENPTLEVFEEMKPTLLKFLEEQKAKIIPAEFKGNALLHVDCSFDPEETMVSKLKEIHASVVVVSTHGRKGFDGLFHSSFTDHMIKFSPCDVYVVRPRKEEPS